MADRFRKPYKHYYCILGLPCSASPSAIRSAYRELALIWHPDKCKSETHVAAAKLKFQDIQEAYAVLSDAQKKLLYDNGLYDPDDDEEEIEGMCSVFKEVTSKIAEMKAEQANFGMAKSFEEFCKLYESLSKTDNQMAHLGLDCPPVPMGSSYLATTHLGSAATTGFFSYPLTQSDCPSMASASNKRGCPPHDRSLPSDIPGNGYVSCPPCDGSLHCGKPGNGYLHNSADMSHGGTNAKRKKHRVEQESHSSFNT